MLGAVGKGQVFLDGQSVEVGPEGDGAGPLSPAQGIKPRTHVHQLQIGVGLEKVHEDLFGGMLLTGALWVGVQGVAQRHGQIEQGGIHSRFLRKSGIYPKGYAQKGGLSREK